MYNEIGAKSEHQYCCDKFKDGIGEFLYDHDDYGDSLGQINIRYLDACYPECGPIYAHIPIEFCPFCGKKL